MDRAYNVLLRLVAPDGAEIWRDEGWPAGKQTTGWSLEEAVIDDRELVIPDGAAPGRYRLMLSLYDPSNGELLPVSGGGVSQEVISLEVRAPVTGDQSPPPSVVGSDGQAGEDVVSPRLRDIEVGAGWDDVQLTALQHALQLIPGQMLRVELLADGRVDGSRKLSARLVDPAGTVKAQSDVILEPFTRIELDLPDDAEPGAYILTAVLYDPETLAPFPDSEGSFATALSRIEVLGDVAQ